jgi:hypothetical protein
VDATQYWAICHSLKSAVSVAEVGQKLSSRRHGLMLLSALESGSHEEYHSHTFGRLIDHQAWFCARDPNHFMEALFPRHRSG